MDDRNFLEKLMEFWNILPSKIRTAIKQVATVFVMVLGIWLSILFVRFVVFVYLDNVLPKW